MPSSKAARSAARRSPLAVTITSVAETAILRHRRKFFAGFAARGIEPADGGDQRLQRVGAEHVEPAVGDAALDRRGQPLGLRRGAL